MIRIQSICEVGKSYAAKREKDKKDAPIVRSHLKIVSCFIEREVADEIIGMPVGWSEGALFDELGAPRANVSFALHNREFRVTGKITGPNDSPKLSLLQADLTGIELTVIRLGYLLAGSLSWTAKGDEVEDVSELLGATCSIDVELSGNEQGDLLAMPKGEAAKIDNSAARIAGV